jgi:hypothetical protein
MPNVTNASVLKMAKYELKHFNRFSNDVSVDSEATKSFYDSKIMNRTNKTLKGYVHDIRQHNYGILFYSEKQVCNNINLTD